MELFLVLLALSTSPQTQASGECKPIRSFDVQRKLSDGKFLIEHKVGQGLKRSKLYKRAILYSSKNVGTRETIHVKKVSPEPFKNESGFTVEMDVLKECT